jgi:hypothetical protein
MVVGASELFTGLAPSKMTQSDKIQVRDTQTLYASIGQTVILLILIGEARVDDYLGSVLTCQVLGSSDSETRKMTYCPRLVCCSSFPSTLPSGVSESR